MIPSSSVRSLLSASSSRTQASELSHFEKSLPQNVDVMEASLSRGIRMAMSNHLAGSGKVTQVLERSAKTYSVTVEPTARTNMVKELLRHGDVNDSATDFGLELPSVRFNNAVMDAMVDERYDRSLFRKERLRRFNKHRFVPALASDRLVPCWRAGTAKESCDVTTPAVEAARKLETLYEAMAASGRQKSPQEKKREHKSNKPFRRYKRTAFVMPTVSVAMKRQDKFQPEDSSSGWHVSGASEAREVMCPKLPAFESGGVGPLSEEVESQKNKDYKESKKLWLSTDVVPPGKGGSQASEEVQEIREQSKAHLHQLQSEYIRKREQHRKIFAERGESSFERYLREAKIKSKQAAEEANKATEEKTGPRLSNFAGLLSIGKSNHRTTQSDLQFGGTLPAEATALPNV